MMAAEPFGSNKYDVFLHKILKKKRTSKTGKFFTQKLYMWENLTLFLWGILQHFKNELLT
jgi:hypothetical protein